MFLKFSYIFGFYNVQLEHITNKTALHMAFEMENVDIIRLLLNHKGIDFNAKNEIYTFF